MSYVHILVREDFADKAKKFADDTIVRSFEILPEDLWRTPYPKTTRQHGIFNVPCVLLGFNMTRYQWGLRQVSLGASVGIQELPEVSHTSVTYNAAPLLINENSRIEGLDINSRMHFDRLHITTHFDAHRGYVKDCKAKLKSGLYDKTEFAQRTAQERDHFSRLQSDGYIPTHLECCC